MKLTRSFEKKDYDSQKKLIIYGASVYGELAFRGLEIWGLKPDFFCDRASAGREYMGGGNSNCT